MSRTKTWRERRRKIGTRKKLTGETPIVKPIDINSLTSCTQALVLDNVERSWITRNSKCPCNSGRRFKKCCMEIKKGSRNGMMGLVNG